MSPVVESVSQAPGSKILPQESGTRISVAKYGLNFVLLCLNGPGRLLDFSGMHSMGATGVLKAHRPFCCHMFFFCKAAICGRSK